MCTLSQNVIRVDSISGSFLGPVISLCDKLGLISVKQLVMEPTSEFLQGF